MMKTQMRVSSPALHLYWSKRFVVFDAAVPRDVMRSMVAQSSADFAVLACQAPDAEPLLFVVRRDELIEREKLELLPDDASTVVTGMLVSINGPSRAGTDAAPWRGRVVLRAVDDAAMISAVGEWRDSRRDALDSASRRVVQRESIETKRGGQRASDGTLTRFPSMVPSGPAKRGSPLYINVDLLPHLDGITSGQALRIVGLPADWSSIDVDVLLSCPHLTFPSGRNFGVVRVHRSGDSEPCSVRAIVRDDLAAGLTSVRVDAYFRHEGRHCGMASVDIACADTEPGATPLARADGKSSFRLDATGVPPVLRVYIRRHKTRVGRLEWTLDPSGDRASLRLPPVLSGESTIGRDPERYVQGMFETLGETEASDHLEKLRSFGFRLYRDATPRCFKDVYWILRAHYGDRLSIQFMTDEPHIPWELMRPAEDDGRRADLLVVEHPVARWNLGWEGYMSARLPAGSIATIAPDYANHPSLTILPAAQREATDIRAIFGEAVISPPATIQSLKALLYDRSPSHHVAILHFAGHGSFNVESPDQSYIALEDGDLTVAVVNSPEVSLGLRCGTFVIFDACEVAGTGAVLDTLGGWATAFLSRRFSGFIAPLWAVDDEHSATAMTALLQYLVVKRMPLGEALRAIRRAFGAESATYYSYLCFGDVMARVAPESADATDAVIDS